MSSEEFVRGMFYLSLTVVGVPSNIAVVVAFLLLIYRENRLLAADAIILHLACTNLLVVVVRCLMETLASFYLANVFGDTGCRIVIFIYRTSRALSIWLTFLLSAYQCLSIAPPGSRWATARAILAQYLVFIFVFLWVLNTTMSQAAILFTFSTKNNFSLTNNAVNVQYCHVNFPSKLSKEINGALQVGRDVVPMALMTLASLIIVALLYKHSQQVKVLRSGSRGSGGAEQRTAKAVVVLVTMYVILYGVDNGLWVYTLTVKTTMSSSLISDLRVFFASLYSALSPLVIIASNRKVNSNLRCAAQEKPDLEKSTYQSK
ncbi:olfactory receptor class A-like protein 1 [Melanotaenia boesemani]|uniref:olfactory receptor class A-like protein 1 n=1 Tax=Melanotaenia boesemani TaxID=1250792 RepID=UPI001C05D404|nr:olfactory receptor class A-like protein 1 [Melanotaenia boesemani]